MGTYYNTYDNFKKRKLTPNIKWSDAITVLTGQFAMTFGVH